MWVRGLRRVDERERAEECAEIGTARAAAMLLGGCGGGGGGG